IWFLYIYRSFTRFQTTNLLIIRSFDHQLSSTSQSLSLSVSQPKSPRSQITNFLVIYLGQQPHIFIMQLKSVLILGLSLGASAAPVSSGGLAAAGNDADKRSNYAIYAGKKADEVEARSNYAIYAGKKADADEVEKRGNYAIYAGKAAEQGQEE
ncbi:hypothetical protein F5Y15DRAFT_220849, partial [Xylariaceae sp. FL0016]